MNVLFTRDWWCLLGLGPSASSKRFNKDQCEFLTLIGKDIGIFSSIMNCTCVIKRRTT